MPRGTLLCIASSLASVPLRVHACDTPKWFCRPHSVDELKDKLRNKETLTSITAPKEQGRFQMRTHSIPGTTTGTYFINTEIYIGQKMWLSEIRNWASQNHIRPRRNRMRGIIGFSRSAMPNGNGIQKARLNRGLSVSIF